MILKCFEWRAHRVAELAYEPFPSIRNRVDWRFEFIHILILTLGNAEGQLCSFSRLKVNLRRVELGGILESASISHPTTRFARCWLTLTRAMVPLLKGRKSA